ncbi:Mannosylglycerate hydrolase [compost metagenome]
MAHELAESTHVYLLRKLALSCEVAAGRSPLILVNPLPEADRVIARYRVFTASADFSLWFDDEPVAYSVVAQQRDYGGIWRKDESLHDEQKYYYLTEIEVMIDLPAFGYKVAEVVDGGEPIGRSLLAISPAAVIENEHYRVWVAEGEIHLFDRRLGKEFTNVLSFENDGDAGDNYDHCPPEQDWCLALDLAGAEVTVTELSHSATLSLKGEWRVPSSLAHRARQEADKLLPFSLELTLKEGGDVIGLHVAVHNQSLNHRLRMLVNTQIASRFSRAGTQFYEVERETEPKELAIWREQGFVEEPTTTEPLLNHVSLIGEQYYTSVFTHGCKEYQVVGEAFDRLAITLFRACGHFGLPDLSRRPGRASGLAEKLIPTPDSQLQKSLSFDLALHFGQHYQANRIRQRYVKFAALNPYYHEQSLSRTGEFNISYFHTNPLGFKVPNQYSLGELKGSEAVFSTLLKGPDGGYLLRLCNCEERAIQPGELCSAEGIGMKAMANLLGHELTEARMDSLSAGQLGTYILG